MFGEGSTVLTDGQNAVPTRVLESGFSFEFENIDDVVANILRE